MTASIVSGVITVTADNTDDVNPDLDLNLTSAGGNTGNMHADPLGDFAVFQHGSDGTNESEIDSTLGESVRFVNPTDSLTIELEMAGGTGDDTVSVQGLDAMFDADLTINGGSGDTVSFQTSSTDIGTGNLNVSVGTINQNAGLTVGGTTTLDAGAAGTIALGNSGNDFGGALTITNADTADIVDANSLAIDSVTTQTSFFAEALAGNITDASAGEAANVTTSSVALRATTGIGDAAVDDSDIDLAVTNVAATSADGDISLSDDDGLTISTVDSLAGVSITTGGAGEDILIREGTGSGDLDIDAGIANGGEGDVTLSADEGTGAFIGNVQIDADITSMGGDILIAANTNVNLVFAGVAATRNISTTGTGTVEVHAGRKVSFAGVLSDGAAGGDINTPSGGLTRDYIVSSGSGDIALTAPDQLQLGRVSTTGTVIITADRDANGDGAVEDRHNGEGAGNENVVATNLSITAGTGIGTDASNIDTAVSNLSARTVSGDINIRNVGGLTVTTVNSVSGVTITDASGTADSGLDNITLIAASPLTVNQAVVNNDGGDITLTASGTADTDDLTISANVTATGGDGAIDLDAGGDLIIDSNAEVTTVGSGAITGDALRSVSISTTNAKVQTVSGSIGLTAAGTVPGHYVGLTVDDATITTTSGAITLSGTGSGTMFNSHGVVLTNSATIEVRA